MNIERDVPIPSNQYIPRTIAGEIGSKLQVGDSVFCLAEERETVRQAIYRCGGQPKQRVEFKDGVKGWRVWRIK